MFPDVFGFTFFFTFQISSHQLCLRLSYRDVQMFMQILKSLPKQTAWARNMETFNEDIEMPVNTRSMFYYSTRN